MTLLEAVNIVLRALSEHTVSSVEIRHPSVTLALDKIEIAREEVLNEGWWFNNIYITINRDSNNNIVYPAGALQFVPDKYECIVRDGLLYNTDSQSFVFSEDVSGVVTYDIAWDDLPNAAQRLVAFSAAASAYSDDMGGDPPQSVISGLSMASSQLQAMHVRQRRYSAKQRPQWVRYESARRG